MLAGRERDGRAVRACKLERHGDERAALIALHDEVQVRSRAEARVAGIGEILAAAHALARHDADRVPVQVNVQRHRAVVVQDAHDVGARAVDGEVRAALEEVAGNLDDDAFARREHVGADGHHEVDGVLASRVRVRRLVGERLRDADGARERIRQPVRLSRPMLGAGLPR